MPTLNASGTVVSINEADDGKVTIGIDSRRTAADGLPSFKLSYEFPAGSPAIATYPLDTIVEFAITTTPPAVDVVTTSKSLFNTPEPTETAPEAPQSDPAPVVEQTPTDGAIDYAPGVDGQPPTPIFATPASDVVAPTITNDTPAVESAGMANAPISDVKAALGI